MKDGGDEPKIEVKQCNDTTLVIENCARIRFISKPTREDVKNPVAWEELPEVVFSEFSELSKGLLRNFALNTASAIRQNIHSLIAQYSPGLDGAYVGHRIASPDPADAKELAIEIISSDLSMMIKDVVDSGKSLGSEEISAWLDSNPPRESLETYLMPIPEQQAKFDTIIRKEKELRERDKKTEEYKKGETHEIVDEDKIYLTTKSKNLKEFIDNGIKYEDFKNKNLEIPKKSKPFFHSLYKDDKDVKTQNNKFAELCTISRGAYSGRKPLDLQPYLTTGTLIKSIDGEEFLLCLQPRCDTVRLIKTTVFPFMKMVTSKSQADLTISVSTEKDGQTVWLKGERKPSAMRLLAFDPGAGKTVGAEFDKAEGKYIFSEASEGGRKWEWIADLREIYAQKYITLMTEQFNRIGVNDSQWIRAVSQNGPEID